MPAESPFIIAAYGLGVAGVVGVCIRNYFRTRHSAGNSDGDLVRRPIPEQPQASPYDLPGRVFEELIDLKTLLDGMPEPENREIFLKKRRSTYQAVSRDISGYIYHRYGIERKYRHEDKTVLQNVAVCIGVSFVTQILKEGRRSELSDDYSQAILELIKRINDYIVRGGDRDEFVENIIPCKTRIYYSLYEPMTPDPDVIAQFKDEIAYSYDRVATQEGLAAYLEQLQVHWVAQDKQLRKLTPELVMALMTVKNVLRHCLVHIETEGAQEKIAEFTQLLQDGRYTRVCYEGLKYDGKFVENTCEDIFDAFDRMTVTEVA